MSDIKAKPKPAPGNSTMRLNVVVVHKGWSHQRGVSHLSGIEVLQ